MFPQKRATVPWNLEKKTFSLWTCSVLKLNKKAPINMTGEWSFWPVKTPFWSDIFRWPAVILSRTFPVELLWKNRMVIYSLPCGVERDSPKRFHSLFQTHTQKPSLVSCLFLQHFIVTSFLAANRVYFFFTGLVQTSFKGFIRLCMVLCVPCKRRNGNCFSIG